MPSSLISTSPNLPSLGNHYLFLAQDGGSQNLWIQTQMYYKLWMYYHLTGHKTDFFPTPIVPTADPWQWK